MEANHIPGLAVALVDRNGPLWIEGFGSIDGEGSRVVDEHTLFSIQSTSKVVTTTAVLTAVRDGLVELDEPITAYVPNFTVNSRFEKHPERRMTLRHLLSHRAGFTHEAPVGNNYAPDFPSFDAHIDSIQRTWLRYPVGSHSAYSNLGVDLAGYILGVVSRRSFPEYARTKVLEPVGMKDGSFDWPTIMEAENRAIGHWSLVDHLPVRFAMIPSGGLYASAADMAAFLRFQLNDGEVDGRGVLDPALLAEMRMPSFSIPGNELGYCLGLRRYMRFGRPYFNHAGGGFGFKTHMSWYPALGVGIAVMVNTMDDGGFAHQLAGDIISSINQASGLEEPSRSNPFSDLKVLPSQPPSARRLLGTYLGRGSDRIAVVLSDDVVSMSIEGEILPLQFVSPTECFIDWGGGKRELFKFTLDPDGMPLDTLRVWYGTSYDFDEGPAGAPPGPDKPEWEAYLGSYEIILVDKVLQTVELKRDNGYLVFDDNRLTVEHEPGLFFDVRGEALDLRNDPPTWANIPLKKIQREQ